MQKDNLIFFFKVKASDQDGRFSSIKYFIISGNLDGYFTINQTSGLVRTNTSFDYESMNHHFFLIVQASDGECDFLHKEFLDYSAELND